MALTAFSGSALVPLDCGCCCPFVISDCCGMDYPHPHELAGEADRALGLLRFDGTKYTGILLAECPLLRIEVELYCLCDGDALYDHVEGCSDGYCAWLLGIAVTKVLENGDQLQGTGEAVCVPVACEAGTLNVNATVEVYLQESFGGPSSEMASFAVSLTGQRKICNCCCSAEGKIAVITGDPFENGTDCDQCSFIFNGRVRMGENLFLSNCGATNCFEVGHDQLTCHPYGCEPGFGNDPGLRWRMQLMPGSRPGICEIRVDCSYFYWCTEEDELGNTGSVPYCQIVGSWSNTAINAAQCRGESPITLTGGGSSDLCTVPSELTLTAEATSCGEEGGEEGEELQASPELEAELAELGNQLLRARQVGPIPLLGEIWECEHCGHLTASLFDFSSAVCPMCQH